jgi:DnaJ-class molecular chaperone
MRFGQAGLAAKIVWLNGAMSDPYKILGVSKSASGADIKSAYRVLAKKHHPDLNAGNAEKFKEVSGAYDILSDETKRTKFDRGDLDTSGNEKPGTGFWRGWPGRPRGRPAGGPSGNFSFDQFGDEDDIFADILRSGGRSRSGGGTRSTPQPVRNTNYKLTVPFEEATAGVRKRVTLSDGKVVDMAIPAGSESGSKLRLKGQGRPGPDGKTQGDAVIEISVEPHTLFTRDDQDILVEIPVTLYEAVLGDSIVVPTIHGNVTLKIPPNSNTGSILRLKGKGVSGKKGVPAGDQYVTLHVLLPDSGDPELTELITEWAKGHSYNPRHKLKVSGG